MTKLEKRGRRVSLRLTSLREIGFGVLSPSYHSDLLCCIIFQFLDYFASVDLFVRSVCPGDCSRTALGTVYLS